MSLTVLGELSEDVFEDEHESHGDVIIPTVQFLKQIDFRMKITKHWLKVLDRQ